MKKKRAFLILGCAGIVASGVRRVDAAGPAQVDVEGYGGASAGEWACGPSARATYAGAGGTLRVHPGASSDSDPREPEGIVVQAGGAVESRGYELLRPPGNDSTVVPPTRTLAAGQVAAGWDGRYFGVRAGVLAHPRWSDADATSPVYTALPAVDLRFARRIGLHAGVAFGGYDVPTLFRPGGALYLAYGGEDGWLLDVRAGPHFIFDEDGGFRGAVSFRYPMSELLALGAGAAVNGGMQWLPEGRLFFVVTP